MRLRLLVLTAALCLALVASAFAAAPAGRYRGKVDYQGYEVTFQVKGAKLSAFKARMLQDCSGDGSSEQVTIAPDGVWPIKGGRVKAKKVETVSKTKVTYLLEGRFSGRAFKGSIREYDYVAGVGIVCDTLKRTFSAKR